MAMGGGQDRDIKVERIGMYRHLLYKGGVEAWCGYAFAEGLC